MNTKSLFCVSLFFGLTALASAGAAAEPAVRVVLPNAPRTLDPHVDPTQVGDTIFSNVFEALVDVDADGQVTPVLATKWESLGELEWRFELRKGVRFHDGTEMTSRDVAASILRARNHPESETRSLLESLKSAEVEGPNTLRVELRMKDAVFLKKLTQVPIVRHNVPDTIVDPVGTGPYRVVSAIPRESINLAAFAQYRRKHDGIDEVEIVYEEDRRAALEKLKAGRADVVSSLTPDMVMEVEDDPELWVDSTIGSLVYFMALNANKAPFEDALMREAVDAALDREQIAAEGFLSYARPAGQLVNDSAYGHAPDVDAPARNLVRAKALASVASQGRDAGFTIEVVQGNTRLAELVRRQLAEAGLSPKIQERPWNELLTRLLSGELDAAIFTWRSDLADVGFTFDYIVYSASPSAPGTGPSADETDRLIVASRTMLDPELRLGVLHSVTERVAQRRALLPLIWSMDLYGVRRNIEWHPDPDGVIEFKKMKWRK